MQAEELHDSLLSQEVSVTEGFDAFGAANEVVAEGTEQGGKEDDERPHDFVVAFRGFLGNTIDQYPYPKDEGEDGYAIKAPIKKVGQVNHRY
jgi:hypothetical protein